MIDLRRAGLIGALSFSVVLVAACGGATPAANATATPVPAGEATPTPAPGTEATPTPEPVGEATPELAIPSFDINALAGALPVDSYRTSVSIGGVESYQSVVVTKPVLSKAITVLDEGTVATRFIVIGDEAWMAEGADGAFEAVPAAMASSMLLIFDPAMMLGGFATVDWSTPAWQVGTEQKNGVQAHHVHIDSTSGLGAANAIPAGAAVDVWVADAGYLVAWEMSGFPDDANMSIQVTNVDDPANQVERPD